MILVTGANGFLGRYVCSQLLRDGHEVCAMVRDPASLDSYEHKSDLEIRVADLRDPVSIREAITGTDRIIHCAAVVSFDPADCQEMMETNVEGTRNLVNAALHQDISYFIHISSVAALGRIARTGTITEDARWQDSRWNLCYGESKHQAELEIWRSISEGLPAVVLNPSVIIGRPVPGAMSNKLFDFVRNRHSFYPTGNLNYVDVRDVCRLIAQLLDKPVYGERYIVNAASIPYREFFERAADRMGVPAPGRPAGELALKLARAGDFIRKIFTGKKRSFTKGTARLSKTEIYFSNEKASRELNFTFAPLSESLQWILNGQDNDQ